jgi:alanyl-tRNA synthetase
VFATSNSPGGVDAGAVLKTQLAPHGGRGGGNARIAQGTVPTREALEAVVATL